MNFDAGSLHADVGKPRRAHDMPQASDGQQAGNLHRNGTVAIFHFFDDKPQIRFAGGLRERAVHLKAQALGVDIGIRNVGINGQVDTYFFGCFISTIDHFAVGERPECLHCLTHEPHIQVEPHPGDMPGLFRTENIPGTAHFQILHGYSHAGTEVVVLRDCG